jgi:two-component system sensor histidine kinase TctE
VIVIDGTLKRSLVGWLLATVSILGTFLLIEAYTSAERAADQSYDSQLEAASLTIAEAVQWQDGQPVVKVPAAAFQILATDQQERVFYTLLNTKGQQTTGNLDPVMTESLHDAFNDGASWKFAQYKGARIRLYGRELKSAGWASKEAVQIWVGHTVSGRDALASTLFLGTLVRFLAMVALTAVLSLLAIRMALHPVRRLRRTLLQRDADDVSPLDARVPGELYDMVETLNALFERQRQGRNALLRFTADASHQLKTPLAGLQSVSELALQSDRPEDWRQALQTVHDSSERTSRLAGQLLSLARLRHGTDTPRIQLDLAHLLRVTVMEWAERNTSKDHDLGLAPLPSDPVIILGDPYSLGEMIGNLIDNALRYTEAGCEITLALEQTQELVTLVIYDNGPGVSQDVLDRLHQPFERGGRQDTTGSGLGLAIVDSIAQMHNANLLMRSEPDQGLWIGIQFPRSTGSGLK